jgi:U3 small nucleolar RNA-associated protein 20
LEACIEPAAVRLAFPSIIWSIAELASGNADEAKRLVYRVVSRVTLEGEEEEEDDNLFPMASEKTGVICDTQACLTLLEICMSETIDVAGEIRPEKLADLSYTARFIPFLCSIAHGLNAYNGEKRTLHWILKNLEILVKSVDGKVSSFERVIPASLLIECFACVATLVSDGIEARWLRQALSRCKLMAWDLLLLCPRSLWVTRASSSLCDLLRKYEIPICDDANAAFDHLVSNLSRESHFLRLYTLRLLTTFPTRPYVTNHRDLDLMDDLDEEPSIAPPSEGKQGGLSGNCDLLETLLRIESSPVGVDTERTIAGLLTRVEVLGKSGRLPVVYAEALANHMIGVFHVKFSSWWAGACRALSGLSDGYHTILCEATCDALERLLSPDHSDTQLEAATIVDLDPCTHQKLCIAWDMSGGRDASLFQARIDAASHEGRVSPFLSTDCETVFQQVMKVLESVPEITAKYSRRIVPMFLDFLKGQYYCFHDQDPDSRELQVDKWLEGQRYESLCLFDVSTAKLTAWLSRYNSRAWSKETIHPRSLQSRLLSFLKVFAAVRGSQQLYKRSVLLSIFYANLSHQDAAVAGTSLTCLVNFKFSYVSQYAEKLQHLLRKGGLRDALLDFNLSRESETIHAEHREHILPIIERILFGRLSTSSMRGVKAKDSPLARRKAIVSSLSQLEGMELFPMIYLMIRNYIPASFDLKWEEVVTATYQEAVLNVFTTSPKSHFENIPIQRHEGFLNLLSVLVGQLGRSLDRFIPSFMPILLGIMSCPSVVRSQEIDDTSAEKMTENEAGNSGDSQRLRSVKTLSFRCTAALIDKFAQSTDFTQYSDALWDGISAAVTTLPDVVAKSSSSPSILSLLVVLSSHQRLRPILEAHRSAVESVVLCIGPTSDDKALDAALDFVLNLMNSPSSSSPSDDACDDLIGSHVLLLLRQFRSRFGGVVDGASGLVRSVGVKNTKMLSKELLVLRKVADVLLDGRFLPSASKREDVEIELYNTLSSLLVQFLGHPRCQEADKLNVLRIVSVLLPKVDVPTALSHYASLSKVLSFDSWSRFSPLARREVTETMRVISGRNGMNPALDRITRLLQEILAVHSKRVDEMDYDRVIPALSGLYDDSLSTDWASLLNTSSTNECLIDTAVNEPKFLTPIVYACLALLQQDDVVVSRSAFKALRHLISSSSEGNPKGVAVPETPWSKFVETAVIPGARCALRNSNEQIRRHAISLIAEVSKTYANCSSQNLHGDLSILGCEENPDLDFFLNILHVQSHRRSRALQRLRNSLNVLEGSGTLLSVNSLSNVILPLVTFPIYECKSSLEEGLAQESIATVGALGRHLSWSKYHAVLWTALNQVSRHPNQERLIVGMICALLDGFHFDLIGTDFSTNHETAVWRALEKRVIPKVESLMVNEKRDRYGKTTRSIRPNVVLALLKILRKFPSDYFEKRLPRLLAIVCDSLKNRDSNVRELARKAMAAMIVEMGPAYLSEAIRSLAITLTEGYQLHVRSATLHHILFHLSKVYAPPKGTAIVPEFDRCIPAMMDLTIQDMFGVASERRDDDGAPKKLVKEAAGSKYLDSVEMICQLLLFKPSERDSNLSSGGSSVHHVVKPFFEKLKDETISTKSIQKVKECLRRIITGLARNESACENDLLQFAYATIAPVVEWSMKRDPLSSGNTNMSSSKGVVVVWQPRSLAAPQNAKGAMNRKLADQANLAAVKDGAQAPKLTGSARHAPTKHIDQINSPAGVCAIEFGLNLLLATVKCKNHPNTGDIESRLSPFLTLLTTCVCETRENVVTTLAIRCIALLLKRGVKPSPEVLNPLGAKIIDILSQGEAIIGANQEMTQTCLIALTTIMKLQVVGKQLETLSRETGTQDAVLSLSEEQLIVLISLLKESVMACDGSNAALGTIKALLSQRFASPELYDLMETILDLSVRSHKESFRDVSVMYALPWNRNL